MRPRWIGVHDAGRRVPERGARVGRVDVDADGQPAGAGMKFAPSSRAIRRARRRRRRQSPTAACCPRPASSRHCAPPRTRSQLQPIFSRQGAHSARADSIDVRVLCGRHTAASIGFGRVSTVLGCGAGLRKPTLLVIDGHSLAFRAFYALRSTVSRPGRAAHERHPRLPLDADQPAQEREAHPPRGRVRHLPVLVPHPGVRRVQGQPRRDAARVQGPDPAARRMRSPR